MSNFVRVDDNNTSIQYSQPAQAHPWEIQGISKEYNRTTHFTSSSGANVTFKFTGISIAVYGTIDSTRSTTPTVSTYTIDGSPPSSFTTNTTPSVQYQQRFYQSHQLSNGEHTLVIEMTSKNGLYWLDYIEYILPNVEEAQTQPGTTVMASAKKTTVTQSNRVPTKANTGSTSTSLASTSFDTSQPIRTGLSNTNGSTSNNNTGSVPKSGGIKTPVGVIVGTALGVVVLLLVVFAVISMRRRRKGIRRVEVQPFDVGIHETSGRNGGERMREVVVDASHSGAARHSTDSIVYPYHSIPRTNQKSNRRCGANGDGNATGSSALQVRFEPGQTMASASLISSSHLSTSPNNHHTSRGGLSQSEASVTLNESGSSVMYTGTGTNSTNAHGDMYNYEYPFAYRSDAPLNVGA